MVGRRFELPGISAGENATAGWCALGVGREGMGEEHALFGHAIKTGSLDPLAAISAGVAKRPVVGHSQEDVWPSRRVSGVGQLSWGKESQKYEAGQSESANKISGCDPHG